MNRCLEKYSLGDEQGAIADCQMNKIDKFDSAYSLRGMNAQGTNEHKQGNEAEAYKLGAAAIKKEKRSTNLDFLRKEATWSEILIKDAVKFFQSPQISGIR